MTSEELMQSFADDIERMIKNKADPRDIRKIIALAIAFSHTQKIGLPSFVAAHLIKILAAVDYKEAAPYILKPVGQKPNGIKQLIATEAATLLDKANDKKAARKWVHEQLHGEVDVTTVNRWFSKKAYSTTLTYEELRDRFTVIAEKYVEQMCKKS